MLWVFESKEVSVAAAKWGRAQEIGSKIKGPRGRDDGGPAAQASVMTLASQCCYETSRKDYDIQYELHYHMIFGPIERGNINIVIKQ